MTDESFDFLKLLLETPSPSGFEEPNAANIRRYAEGFADTITTNPMGSVIACVNPGGSPRVMLSGHMDELGFIVTYINDEGYIYFRSIGGQDSAIVVGQRVALQTSHGPVSGVIGRKPVHLLNSDERGKAPEMHDLWIDIGVTGGKDEVRDAGIEVGTCAVVDLPLVRLRKDLIAARAVDNRVGAWVVFEALRRVKEHHPRAAVYAVATVQEEVGMRGAYTAAHQIDPQVGIAVDVTFASDFPTMDKRRTGEIKVGAGPTALRGANVTRKLGDRMAKVGYDGDIAIQWEASPGVTGTDAGPMQITRNGMALALIGVPLRYMHTPGEIISLGDADKAADLIALTCASLSPEDDWTP